MRPETPEADELLAVLESEERLYLELRELLQRERKLIVDLDAGGLEEVVRRKEALASEGRLLEEGRVEAARRLAERVGADAERPTLGALCDALGEDAAPLRRAHSRLVALVGATRELLDANAGFAGDALGQVRATLQLLGRLVPGDGTYAPGLEPGPEVPLAAGTLLRRSA
jgi:hypothetical protein